MKKLTLITNVILITLIWVGDMLYNTFGLLWMKGVTSGIFLLLGIANLLFALKFEAGNLKFSILLVVGLLFAMLGDIILNVNFIAGAALFAVGHIFFLASYLMLEKFDWKDLLYGLAIFTPSVLFITLAPIFNFEGVLMEIICVVYALIISMMVGKALSNMIKTPSILHIFIFIGSVLFFISDLMLLLNKFAGLPRIVDVLCLATYYPAQAILALTPLLASKFINWQQKN